MVLFPLTTLATTLIILFGQVALSARLCCCIILLVFAVVGAHCIRGKWWHCCYLFMSFFCPLIISCLFNLVNRQFSWTFSTLNFFIYCFFLVSYKYICSYVQQTRFIEIGNIYQEIRNNLNFPCNPFFLLCNQIFFELRTTFFLLMPFIWLKYVSTKIWYPHKIFNFYFNQIFKYKTELNILLKLFIVSFMPFRSILLYP